MPVKNRFRRFVLLAAASLLVIGVTASVEAEEPVPGSCKPHSVHVVNPGCVPTLVGPVVEPEMALPNLVPDVRDVRAYRPLVLDQERQEFVPGPLHLGFDSWVQNFGVVPFQLTLSSPELAEPEVSQCVVWAAPYVCREQRPVGGFVWHGPHQHYHYDDFEKYELRRVGIDGRPDYSDAGLIRLADKIGFCLVDNERIREDASEQAFYFTCTQAAQGTSPGWADVYGYDLPGQQFPIEGLADGRYALVVTLNVTGYLYETDRSDNTVEIIVELSNGLSEAAIVNRKYP